MSKNKLSSYPEWVRKEALEVAKFSRASYGTKGYYLSKKYLIENKETDTQVYVFKIAHIVYVIPRGTEKKLKDILTDLFFLKKAIPYDHTGKIKVHAGFLRAYTSVAEEVRNQVRELILKGANTVIVGGHSLGGDIACFCAVDLQYNGIVNKNSLRGYTFGQAKPGNKYFKESFNKRVPFFLCFRNRFDIVSIIPAIASHVGATIQLAGRIRHDINNYIYNILKVG